MSIVPSNSRLPIALPLTLAVSALLVSACSNTSAVKNTGVKNTRTPVVTKRPAATPQTPASDDYSTAYLDEESLDELADLLEASDMA
ncbi:MAG: hypothetical protein ACR2PP_06045, partial [Psychrobacter sp.]